MESVKNKLTELIKSYELDKKVTEEAANRAKSLPVQSALNSAVIEKQKVLAHFNYLLALCNHSA